MARLIDTDFESETIGQEPTGAGDIGGGTWSVSPAGTCAIANDPAGQTGKVAELGAGGEGTVMVDFADPVGPGETIYSRFSIRRESEPAVGDVFFGFYQAVDWFGMKLDWDTDSLRHEGNIANGSLYSESGHPTTPTPVARDQWHTIDFYVDTVAGVYYVWFDDEPQGFDDEGSWQPAIPIGAAVTAIVRCRWTYYSTARGYVDDVTVSASNHSGELDAPPTRVTFVTNFALDAATVTTFKDSGTPNRKSETLSGANVLTDDPARVWRTEDVSAGHHRILFDLGALNPQVIRFFAVFHHNLASLGAGRLAGAHLVASNSSANIWLSPAFVVALQDQTDLDPIIMWIGDSGQGYRYWGLDFLLVGGPLDAEHIEIGRVVGDTGYFTPSQNFDRDHRWETTDPSIVTELDGGARQARVRSPYRAVELGWRALPIADQEAIESLARASGVHAPWVVLLDPAEQPQKRTLYGYLDDADLDIRRSHAERGRLTLAYREIVP